MKKKVAVETILKEKKIPVVWYKHFVLRENYTMKISATKTLSVDKEINTLILNQ